MLSAVEDVRSDLSRFHRVDDMDRMPAHRFWPLVERLGYYRGAVTAVLADRIATGAESSPEPQAMLVDPAAPVASVDNLDALHAHPLYGDIPGMPPIFSHSTAPLAPEGGDQ